MRKIGVLFGGKSGEHEVSLLSATSVIEALDREKYDVVMIGITKSGQWKLYQGDVHNLADGSWEKTAADIEVSDLKKLADFALPVLHGPYGEDGTIQGLLRCWTFLMQAAASYLLPYAWIRFPPRRSFERMGLPTARYKLVYAEDVKDDLESVVKEVEAELPYTLFVKPSNMGSSVGISKVRNTEELRAGFGSGRKV